MNDRPHCDFVNGAIAQADAWLTPGRFALLLAVCICASYPEVVLGSHTFVIRDFGYFGYPLANYHRESWWRGEIPLWNPLSNCGLPFLAQWNAIVLYPGSLFYLLFPLSWSLGVFCLLHQWFAGLGVYFLARRWTGSRLAASVAGFAFAFNGLMLNSLIWPAIMAALGWMPWVVLLTERAWQEGGNAIVRAVVVGATQMLSGAAEIVLFTWLVLGAFLVVQAWSKRCWRTYFLRIVSVILLITVLTAAQMLPFFDLLRYSHREAGFESAEWAMPATGWANLLVPLFRCGRTPTGIYFDVDQSWTTSYYLGIGPLFLALLALARLREWRVWLLWAFAFLGLVLALGKHGYLYGTLQWLFPQLGLMRYAIKFVILLIFCGSILAGYGAQLLCASATETMRAAWRSGIIVGGILCGLTAATLWFDHQYPLFPESWKATLENGVGRIAFLALILGTLALAGRLNRVRPKLAANFVLLLLLFTDVARHMPRQNPTVPRATFMPGLIKLNPQPRIGETRALMTFPAQMEYLHAYTESVLNNYLISRRGLFLNCNLLDDIAQVHGFFALYLREAAKVRKALNAGGTRPSPRLCDFLGVSRMTAPDNPYDWEVRSSFLPLVTAGQKPDFADDNSAFRALTETNFAPEQIVYLPNEARRAIGHTNQSRINIVSTRFTAHQVEIALAAQEPGLVVIAQSFYHPWRAYVDGKPTRLWRANYAFQAVEVQAGQRRITVAYEDYSWYWGIGISSLALFACLAAWFRRSTVPAQNSSLV